MLVNKYEYHEFSCELVMFDKSTSALDTQNVQVRRERTTLLNPSFWSDWTDAISVKKDMVLNISYPHHNPGYPTITKPIFFITTLRYDQLTLSKALEISSLSVTSPFLPLCLHFIK